MSDPKKTGGPAFPVDRQTAHGIAIHEVGSADEAAYIEAVARLSHGMTLRDFMAIHATEEDLKMQAALIRAVCPLGILPDDWRTTARYMHADSMLKARDA